MKNLSPTAAKSMCERDKMQGARNAETGMYAVGHEDFEYRATQQFARVAID